MPAAVSAVIPAYNAEAFLAQAIESLRWQTYPVDEIIVVDDGSTDGSAAVAAACPAVTLIRQPNLGPGAARNRGIAAAANELILLLDADDVLLPDALERLLGVIPARGMVHGKLVNFLDRPDVPPVHPMPVGVAMPVFSFSGLLADRAAFEAAGPIREDVTRGEDITWSGVAKMREVPLVIVDEVLLLRRLHGGNLTFDPGSVRASLAPALRGILQERRRTGTP